MNNWKKALAAALTVSLSLSALTACGKKSEEAALDKNADYITLESGASMKAGVANLMLRYNQAEFETGFGAFIKSYYGDIWNSDLTGSGSAYGDTFKEQIVEQLEKMLLDEAHMEDLGIEITADEEAAMEEAAKQFLADNADAAEALERMSADEDTVKAMLRYYTIQTKAEAAMSADVDTNVSDEEAAQRTVSYLYITASTEAEEEEEAVSEAVTESAEEADSESVAEAAPAETDPAADVEAETEVKTSSEDETEGAESVAEAAEGVEAETESATEAESETESPEMIEARAVALANAQEFLASVQNAASGEEFDQAASAAAESMDHAYSGSYTFGDDDTYPDAEIIEATKGLEDNTLVSDVIVAGTSYYVLFVSDAFDEEATEEKKADIVEQRKNDMIEAQYETWKSAETIDVNGDISSKLLFDFSLTGAAEAESEALLEEVSTEAMSEGMTEGLSEAVAETVN